VGEKRLPITMRAMVFHGVGHPLRLSEALVP